MYRFALLATSLALVAADAPRKAGIPLDAVTITPGPPAYTPGEIAGIVHSMSSAQQSLVSLAPSLATREDVRVFAAMLGDLFGSFDAQVTGWETQNDVLPSSGSTAAEVGAQANAEIILLKGSPAVPASKQFDRDFVADEILDLTRAAALIDQGVLSAPDASFARILTTASAAIRDEIRSALVLEARLGGSCAAPVELNGTEAERMP
jgi:hypothetical protein